MQSGLCESKSDARRTIKQGGIRINNVVLMETPDDRVVAENDFLEHRLLLLKRGKRNISIVDLK